MSTSSEIPQAQTEGRPATSGSTWRPAKRSPWSGWITFAAILMITLGFYQAIMGLVALFKDTYYLVESSGLVVTVDYTTWGWVHLILGLVAVAAGFALMRGATWGRVVAIVLAVVSALINIAFLSAYPVWCAIVIAFDVIVIYALTVRWDEAST